MNNMSCSDDGNHDARNLFYIRINLKLIKEFIHSMIG